MKQLGARKNLNFVVLHQDLQELPGFILDAYPGMGAIPVKVDPLPFISDGFYKDRLTPCFDSAAENHHYDMDIINLDFADDILFLIDEYACLNAE